MAALIVLSVVAVLVVTLAVVAHRQDVRRTRGGSNGEGRDFDATQADIYRRAGYSGDGTSANPGNFGGPGL
ncbi:MAG: hypothetical protein AAFZ07_27890 [Actinomycetota bacterium]